MEPRTSTQKVQEPTTALDPRHLDSPISAIEKMIWEPIQNSKVFFFYFPCKDIKNKIVISYQHWLVKVKECNQNK